MGNPPELPSLPAGKSRLQQAINMIPTLITLSYSIKVFTVKWHTIRNRLEELLSGLTAIDNRDHGDDKLLSSEVIEAIMDTLSECNELGKRCIESTCSGKLFMQSDLSKLVCKIDTHIECLSDIYTVGLCIVVKRPGALACEDDMKIYVNDLLSRLKIGDNYMKKEALVDFNEVIREDVKYVHICVQTKLASADELNRDLIVKEGGIFVLVDVLEPKSFISSKVGEMALEAIMTLCLESTSTLNIVMNYGIMDHMLHFLQHRFYRVQDLALKAIVWLCETSEEAKNAMGDAGFMPELIKFYDATSIEVRELAAKAISSMISVPKNRKRFIKNQENVGLLVKLLHQEEDNSGDRKLLLSIIMSLIRTFSFIGTGKKNGTAERVENEEYKRSLLILFC